MAERTCSVDGCELAYYARGWCRNHYMQWHRSADRPSIEVVRRPRACTVDGCDKPVKGNGLCPGHWQRNRRYGSPTGSPNRRTAEDRFWSLVKQSHKGCWLWTGKLQVGGYGKFFADGRTILAHRWCYEFMVGAIPDGLHLDHLCFTPACVNPYHLDPVTPAVNNERRDARQLASN